MTESYDKVQLLERTRHRNTTVWVSSDWGGLLTPLAENQEALNLLGLGSIENYLAVSDEAWSLKDLVRDKTDELDQAEITQDRQLVDDKVAMEREKLAIKTATDAYVLAVRVYDTKVRSLLMGAREYAAVVEREQLEIEEARAELAVAKEVLRQDEINAKIYYELIQRAQVEVDIAKAQVDVAKANVRALMADIEAGRAAVELIEAQVQEYVAMAEKATLRADVASIYAEIVTKKLSTIKLDVGRQEIEAGFGYLQSKMDDMLALWDARIATENFKAESEDSILTEVALALAADKAQEDFKLDAIENAELALVYEEEKTGENLAAEAGLRDALVLAKKLMSDKQREKFTEQHDKTTWAQLLENLARRWVHKNMLRSQVVVRSSTETISG